MNLVLVDTSLWIDFFSARPRISPYHIASLREHIVNDAVVLIEPIRAELLSGYISQSLRDDVVSALNALEMIDLDWSSRAVWDDVISLAAIAKSHNLAIPGIVDRMILAAALNANASLASLDRALCELAQKIQITIWDLK